MQHGPAVRPLSGRRNSSEGPFFGWNRVSGSPTQDFVLG